MRIIPAGEKYESKVYVIDKEKLITKLDCMCQDFKFRRIIKVGQGADIKRYSTPCKHLKAATQALIKQGYILKKPREMIGEDILRPKLRRELLDRANNMCEQMKVNEEGVFDICGSTEQLEIHRVIRGSAGGKYNEWNCKVFCHDCHMGENSVHRNEFRGSQGK